MRLTGIEAIQRKKRIINTSFQAVLKGKHEESRLPTIVKLFVIVLPRLPYILCVGITFAFIISSP